MNGAKKPQVQNISINDTEYPLPDLSEDNSWQKREIPTGLFEMVSKKELHFKSLNAISNLAFVRTSTFYNSKQGNICIVVNSEDLEFIVKHYDKCASIAYGIQDAANMVGCNPIFPSLF